MSFNSGRRASVYPDISHLNTLSSEYDMSVPQQSQPADIDLGTDLSLFTDGEFFNFDMGDMNADHMIPFSDSLSQPSAAPHSAFPNGDFQNYPHFSSGQSLPGQGDMKSYPSPAIQDQPATSTARAGDKRKATASSPDTKSSPVGDEHGDPVRAAAEEDKRRRNTAASARFRVKKKQREQAMEKTAKEMTDRVTFLENRVGQLESENKILRDLLTDKVGKDINVAKILAESPKNTASNKHEDR